MLILFLKLFKIFKVTVFGEDCIICRNVTYLYWDERSHKNSYILPFFAVPDNETYNYE